MKKEMHFEDTLPYSIDQVWQVLQDPAKVVVEHNVRVTQISNVEWVEHTTPEIDNTSHAIIDASQKTVTIHTTNSKFDAETNDIILKLEDVDGQTKLHATYFIGTKALFNVITMEVLGEKLMHHVNNTVIKNIKKMI